MNWEFIITALVTITVAVPSFIALKKGTATRIYYIQEDQINFYEKLVKDFRDIKITFKEKPINEKFFLLRGFIFCTGRKDITRDNITKGINIQIEEKSTWHYAKIISTSQDLSAVVSISQPNELLFDMPLIKNGDFIYFEALGESDKEEYTPGYRIANVPPIIAEGIKRRRSRIELLIAYVFILIISIGFLLEPFEVGKGITKDDFKEIYIDNQKKVITSEPILKEIKSYHNKLISFFYDSLFIKYNKYSFVSKNETKKYKITDDLYVRFEYKKRGLLFSSFLFMIFFLFSLYVIIVYANALLKRNKMYKKMGEEIKNRKRSLNSVFFPAPQHF